MTNFFTFAANEATAGSIYYLTSIFGNVGTVLTGTGPAILSTMFKVFNTAVLAVGTLIIGYTTTVSILLTAHEGEMLGKKFHGLWTPLRTVLGIAALVPSAAGYSYLQVGMMWFILQGVGAADTLWSQTVDYIDQNGSFAPAPIGRQVTTSALKNNVGVLFSGLACQAAERAKGLNTPDAYFCTKPPRQPWCDLSDAELYSLSSGSPQVDASQDLAVYKMGQNASGECGTLTLGGATGKGPALTNALQQLVSVLGPVADQLVAIDNAYSNFISPLAEPGMSPPSFVQMYCNTKGMSTCEKDEIANVFPQPTSSGQKNPTATWKTVTGLYWPYGLQPTMGDFITLGATAFSDAMNNASQLPPLSTPTVRKEEKDNGWIYAGAYFYTIAAKNTHASEATNAEFSVTGPETTRLGDNKAVALMMAQATSSANNFIEIVTQQSSSSNSTGPSAPPLKINSCTLMFIPVGGLCRDLIGGWMDALSDTHGRNPIVTAQEFGSTVLKIIENATPIVIMAVIVAGAMGTIALGNGIPVEPLVWDIIILPILFFFAALFLGIGAILAIYTPMIPYLVFAFGAINWMIATIETMIAAPIISIGLIYPEGGHDIWGKTENAIMLILNIFLRPSLMIFGMIAGLLMSYVALVYINVGFLSVVQSFSSSMGILEAVFFMALYTSVFTTTINKCFELIHVVPDKILRWIGGGNEQFGEAGQAVERISQGFQGSVQKGEGAVRSATESGMQHKGSTRRQRAEQAIAKQVSGGRVSKEEVSGKVNSNDLFIPKTPPKPG